MLLRLLSDIHLEFTPFTVKPVKGVDVTVLAGDLASHDPDAQGRLVPLLRSIKTPVIYVPGNHEYYNAGKPANLVRDELRSRLAVEAPHVHFLDRGCVDLGGYRFLGCTLWTAFEVLHKSKHLGRPISQDLAMLAAEQCINDFRGGVLAEGPDASQRQLLRATAMQGWHVRDRLWLAQEIAQAEREGQRVVVVTHFLPVPECCNDKFADSVLNPYFATDCSGLFREPVKLWLHGHTHCSVNTQVNGIPIRCNPRGCTYLKMKHPENEEFDSTLTLELP